MNKQKRIITIHDISCFGKCSLTAAIPILSSAGIETCVIPTAVLSAHTAFSGYTFLDLTDEILKIARHWKSLDLSFDGIYTGYLGSHKQIALVEQVIDMFPAKPIMIDPVMGDNGRLYDGISESYIPEMRRLIKKADVIVPNVTEAAYLADVPYEEGIHSEDYIKTILDNLFSQCDGTTVLTGVHTGANSLGTIVATRDTFRMIETEKVDVEYSGTGDVFASALYAALMQDIDVFSAAEVSVQFVLDCIHKTRETSGTRNYGLNFELCTEKLLNYLKKA